MTSQWIVVACLAIGMGNAVLSGVFLAFSDFIMRALGAAPPIGGAQAMQAINVAVFRSVFLALFFAMVPATLAMAAIVTLAVTVDAAAQAAIVAGTLVYLVAVVGVTGVGNVPMNERLARLDATDGQTEPYWRHYLSRWTRLNHARTVGSALAAAGFLFAATQVNGPGG